MNYKLPNETIKKFGEVEIREYSDGVFPMVSVLENDLYVCCSVTNGRINLFVKRYTRNGFESIYESVVQGMIL